MDNTTLPTAVSNTVKFTDEEFKEFSEIRGGFDQATIAFGRFYLQKIEMERMEAELKSEYDLLEKQERDFFDRITKKYGEGTLDPKTGVFTIKKK